MNRSRSRLSQQEEFSLENIKGVRKGEKSVDCAATMATSEVNGGKVKQLICGDT